MLLNSNTVHCLPSQAMEPPRSRPPVQLTRIEVAAVYQSAVCGRRLKRTMYKKCGLDPRPNFDSLKLLRCQVIFGSYRVPRQSKHKVHGRRSPNATCILHEETPCSSRPSRRFGPWPIDTRLLSTPIKVKNDTCMHAYIHIYTHIHTRMHLCLYVYMHTCLYIYRCMYIQMFVHLICNPFVHLYIHVYIHINMYLYIHTL